MRYISTRNTEKQFGFSEVILSGLASDGGLYIPTHYPKISNHQLDHWREIYTQEGYAELAFAIGRLYIDDIPLDDLRQIFRQTYTQEIFGHPLITPVRQLNSHISLVGLSGGPTLSFKDLALQFLGNLFAYHLQKRGSYLTILGATSGDTGSAAEYALRGKGCLQVVMLSPEGRMSPFQQRQMYTLQDANVHNLVYKGVFDDCQDVVKAINADIDFKQTYHIGAVNSINWARILAQVVYYFASYFQVGKPLSYCVPSGNFGNVLAGHIAREMGLPIHKLIVATNENDVLHEFISQGKYTPRSAVNTYATSSPSMDISKASNFERLAFQLLDGDGRQIQDIFSQGRPVLDIFNHKAFLRLTQDFAFASGKSTHGERLKTIERCYREHGQLIDPHTADGVRVAEQFIEDGIPMLVLETALPAKFSDTIQQALGFVPADILDDQGLAQLPQKFFSVGSQQEVMQYIARQRL
ncbi:MAG: threonine synthase [Gammaproteobacteria bacterium]|nr:threonine synthase [Gammaproteobacteria bacterium]